MGPPSTERVDVRAYIEFFSARHDRWVRGDVRARNGHPVAVSDDSTSKTPAVAEPTDVAPEADLPPVVARLVVEIRSDGSRTVARGALEDHVSGEDVAVAVEADSPAALLGKLSRSLLTLPTMLRTSRPALEATPEPERSRLRRLGSRVRGSLRRRLKTRR